MKKLIICVVISILFNQSVLSQYIDHAKGPFLKSTEANVNENGSKDGHPWYNLERKSILDRIFFKDINSFVEFIAENPAEIADVAWAFRIVKDTKYASCKLEIMQISAIGQIYRFVIPEINRKKTVLVIPEEWLSGISPAIQDSIQKHNEEAREYRFSDRDDDLFKPYHPESQECSISVELAEKLHNTMSTIIHNFKAKGICADNYLGYPLEVTYRCVVGDEVWSLKITKPQKRALLLSNICVQIINDALNNKMNEAEYIKQLEEIDKLGSESK